MTQETYNLVSGIAGSYESQGVVVDQLRPGRSPIPIDLTLVRHVDQVGEA
jgi:hypothetical protein